MPKVLGFLSYGSTGGESMEACNTHGYQYAGRPGTLLAWVTYEDSRMHIWNVPSVEHDVGTDFSLRKTSCSRSDI